MGIFKGEVSRTYELVPTGSMSWIADNCFGAIKRPPPPVKWRISFMWGFVACLETTQVRGQKNSYAGFMLKLRTKSTYVPHDRTCHEI